MWIPTQTYVTAKYCVKQYDYGNIYVHTGVQGIFIIILFETNWITYPPIAYHLQPRPNSHFGYYSFGF